jgi:hypothetical protein
VSKDGNYDTLTGKFLGEYKVTIEQRRPRFLNIFDMNIYRYNTQTKELEETGEVWQLANVF